MLAIARVNAGLFNVNVYHVGLFNVNVYHVGLFNVDVYHVGLFNLNVYHVGLFNLKPVPSDGLRCRELYLLYLLPMRWLLWRIC